MTSEEAIEFLSQYLDDEVYTKKCIDAHNFAISALRLASDADHFHAVTKMVPLTFEQLCEMDGRAVKGVVDENVAEPLKMLALVEYVKTAGAVILRDSIGGVSEYYDDEELQEDGINAYAYPPAHIDREAWEPCELCEKQRKVFNENFCGECGRPLTKEAWAELEKRLRRSVEDGT